jgi:hypothetical protein
MAVSYKMVMKMERAAAAAVVQEAAVVAAVPVVVVVGGSCHAYPAFPVELTPLASILS